MTTTTTWRRTRRRARRTRCEGLWPHARLRPHGLRRPAGRRLRSLTGADGRLPPASLSTPGRATRWTTVPPAPTTGC
eukprot:1005538-Prymnesium_polylepis.1